MFILNKSSMNATHVNDWMSEKMTIFNSVYKSLMTLWQANDSC